MARQAKDYINEIEYAAGSEFTGSLNTLQLVNDVGLYFFNCHTWPWRENATADVNLVAAQAYVDMPTGFSQIIKVNVDGLDGDIPVIDHGMFEDIKQLAPATGTDYYATLVYPTQTAQTAAPGVPRLYLYPIPSASVTGGLHLVYRSKWVSLTAMSHYPNFPEDCELVFVELCRAAAIAKKMRKPIELAFKDIITGKMMQDLIRHYSKASGQQRGYWRGTVNSQYNEDRPPADTPPVESIAFE